MATLIIMLSIGFFMLLLGFLIWKFHLAGFIAGYESEKVKDPDKLAEWVGKCLMANGIMAAVVGGIGYMSDGKNAGLITITVFMVLSSLGMAVTLAGVQRYVK